MLKIPLTILFLGLIAATFLILTRQNSQVSQNVTEEEIQEVEGFSIVAENLEIPWGIAFLPDKSLLITERPGWVRMIDAEGKLLPDPVAVIPAKHIGEGGLLGITIHPDFGNNRFVYLYYTYSENGNNTLNKISRFKLEGNKLAGEEVLIDKIPGAGNHNGGRIKFGPDGFLYITTGDAGNPSQAQNRNSLAGKILRVTDDGKPAPGNPFNSPVYSFGHRNPQGLAWDSEGRLWATEHGRSGAQSGLDELNLIKAGVNYGWPTIEGDGTRAGLESPVANSGDITWAPAGADYFQGSIFFGGLRGEALYEAVLEGDQAEVTEHFKGRFGRIRDVVVGPDNFLYITTSNRDGRGSVKPGDDKIIKVDPQNIP